MDYVGYKPNKKQIGFAAAAAAATAWNPFLAAGLSILPALIPSVSTWVSGWFPAGISGKEQRMIQNELAPVISTMNENDRILAVTGYSTKLTVPDVIARDLLLWYKKTYPSDYLKLSQETKKSWNDYMDQFPSRRYDANWYDRIVNFTKQAKFTDAELNYNAPAIVQNATALTTTGSSNLLMYAALGLGAILLIKNKK